VSINSRTPETLEIQNINQHIFQLVDPESTAKVYKNEVQN